jgi:hypothetical protein
VQPFFERIFQGGGDWLSALLGAAPEAERVLGELVGSPGEMLPDLLALRSRGKASRACFEYEVLPDKSFLRWCVLHPEELTWPKGEAYGEETTRKRCALLYDKAPGRAATQQEALRLIEENPPSARAWWRFEGSSWIDCVIMTDRLVVTVEGKRTEQLSATTDWYPKRSQLVRNLEAARQLSKGRTWATLLLSEEPVVGGQPDELAASLPDAAPHLDEEERARLAQAYLGNVTWEAACHAVGVPFDELPESTDGV